MSTHEIARSQAQPSVPPPHGDIDPTETAEWLERTPRGKARRIVQHLDVEKYLAEGLRDDA